MRFEVLTAVNVKITVFLCVMACSLVDGAPIYQRERRQIPQGRNLDKLKVLENEVLSSICGTLRRQEEGAEYTTFLLCKITLNNGKV
jgi:hypothetical protein